MLPTVHRWYSFLKNSSVLTIIEILSSGPKQEPISIHMALPEGINGTKNFPPSKPSALSPALSPGILLLGPVTGKTSPNHFSFLSILLPFPKFSVGAEESCVLIDVGIVYCLQKLN